MHGGREERATETTTLRDVRGGPFVHYHCPCWYDEDADFELEAVDPTDDQRRRVRGGSVAADQPQRQQPETEEGQEEEEEEEEEEDVRLLKPPVHPASALAPFASLPLSRLYFCEECNDLRCPRCVEEEIVCVYCPNCLLEVPSAAVRGERNRCTRSCFECPVCLSALQVVGSDKARPDVDPKAPVAGPYHLSCPSCHWHSKEVGMEFEKPTWLSNTVQKAEEQMADFAEFEKLSVHFSAHLKSVSSSSSSSASSSFYSGLRGLSSPSAGSPLPSSPAASSPISGRYLAHTYHGRHHRQRQRQYQQQQEQELPPYTPTTTKALDTDDELLSEFMSTVDISTISTMNQRLPQYNDQPYSVQKIRPRRTHLRKKSAKRCRYCRRVLVKPEPKGQSTKFRIKLVAMNYVPTVTLSRIPALEASQRSTLVVTVTNPLYQKIHVRLSVGSSTGPDDAATDNDDDNGAADDRIVLLAPEFTVAPYSDVWEFDDEDSSAAEEGVGSESGSGIVARRRNSTSVAVELVPSARSASKKNLAFPLLVHYTYEAAPDEDVSATTTTTTVAADATRGMTSTAGSKVSKREPPAKGGSDMAESGAGPDDSRMRSYSFWVTVGV